MLRNKSSRVDQHWDVLNFSDVNLYHLDENKLKMLKVFLTSLKRHSSAPVFEVWQTAKV